MTHNRPRELDEADELVEADPDAGTYRATYRYPSQPPSIAVALAMMALTDSDVTDLAPLHDATCVNPDALDELFAPTVRGASRDARVQFTYHDHTVTVKSYGRIVIEATTPTSNSPR